MVPDAWMRTTAIFYATIKNTGLKMYFKPANDSDRSFPHSLRRTSDGTNDALSILIYVAEMTFNCLAALLSGILKIPQRI